MARDKRLYQGVLELMLQMIDSGEYTVGSRLPPERELATRFSVSRPTIREAIIALEALNRVEIKNGSGIYVLETSSKNGHGVDTSASAFELTEARAILEGEAAALAAKMISEEQLEELEGALHELAEETKNGVLVSENADKNFHHIIARATNNTMLISMIDHLWYVRENAPQVHNAYLSICETDGNARLDEHRDIFEAIKQRDSSAARRAMHQHFERILSKLIMSKEEEEVEQVRRKAMESRERFSLNHLSSSA